MLLTMSVSGDDSSVNLDGLARLDRVAQTGAGGEVQILGPCGQRAASGGRRGLLGRPPEAPVAVALRLRTADLTAGTYELSVALSTASNAARPQTVGDVVGADTWLTTAASSRQRAARLSTSQGHRGHRYWRGRDSIVRPPTAILNECRPT